MKLPMLLTIASLLTFSSVGFSKNLTVFTGVYTNHSGYDPRSAACPYQLEVKQTLASNQELVSLEFYDKQSGKLIQKIGRDDIQADSSIFAPLANGTVTFGGPFTGFEGEMVISQSSPTSKYVSIQFKKVTSDYSSHLNCEYGL